MISQLFDSRKVLHFDALPFLFSLLIYADAYLCVVTGKGIFEFQPEVLWERVNLGQILAITLFFIALAVIVVPIVLFVADHFGLVHLYRFGFVQRWHREQRAGKDYVELSLAKRFLIATDNQAGYSEWIRLSKEAQTDHRNRHYVLLSLATYVFGYYVIDADSTVGSVWFLYEQASAGGPIWAKLFATFLVITSLWFVFYYVVALSFVRPMVHLPGYEEWRSKTDPLFKVVSKNNDKDAA